MPIEQRIVNAPARPTSAPGGGIGSKKAAPEPVEEVAPKSRKKLVVILVAVLLAAGAAAYVFLFSGGEPEGEAEPVPGEVLTVEAMSLNLADGRYLRLGLGLQLTEEVHDIDSAKARDAAIALFSGRTVTEIADPATRDALKSELAHTLHEAYEGEVIDVYLTEYVTQ